MRRLLKSWLTPLTMAIVIRAIFAFADVDPKNSNAQQVGDKFTCEGRGAGFYADIPSGCQMYHMCDEAGRVFTHACPERTLFQQRNMVCDHWYMVECNGTPPTLRASLPRQATGQAQVQVVPTGGFTGRKRHSQRVLATFPYQRGNYTSSDSNPVKSSSDKLESFKISSFPSSTQRIPLSSAATIERVERPTFVPINQNSNFRSSGERDPVKYNGFTPVVARARIERVFKEPALTSPGGAVISRVQFTSSFQEPKTDIQIVTTTTTPRPSTEVAPSLIENKYNNNPYFETYFRSSFTVSPPPPSTSTVETTTQGVTRDEEEEDNSENRVEIVIPDPRKMFYIPDSNYDSGDALKEGGTVLIIELPGKRSTKFQEVDETEAKNHDCPQCHPSFLIPGLCRPCVLIT